MPGIHRLKFENGGQTVDILAWDLDSSIRHIDFNEYNHLSYSSAAVPTSTSAGWSGIDVDTPAGRSFYASGLINPEIPHKFIDASHIFYAQGNAVGVIHMEADEASWVQEFDSPVIAFSVVPGSKAIAITTRDRGFIGRYFFHQESLGKIWLSAGRPSPHLRPLRCSLCALLKDEFGDPLFD
jgi:hypothetical protein